MGEGRWLPPRLNGRHPGQAASAGLSDFLWAAKKGKGSPRFLAVTAIGSRRLGSHIKQLRQGKSRAK